MLLKDALHRLKHLHNDKCSRLGPGTLGRGDTTAAGSKKCQHSQKIGRGLLVPRRGGAKQRQHSRLWTVIRDKGKACTLGDGSHLCKSRKAGHANKTGSGLKDGGRCSQLGCRPLHALSWSSPHPMARSQEDKATCIGRQAGSLKQYQSQTNLHGGSSNELKLECSALNEPDICNLQVLPCSSAGVRPFYGHWRVSGADWHTADSGTT